VEGVATVANRIYANFQIYDGDSPNTKLVGAWVIVKVAEHPQVSLDRAFKVNENGDCIIDVQVPYRHEKASMRFVKDNYGGFVINNKVVWVELPNGDFVGSFTTQWAYLYRWEEE
jgi:hypothetical protein